MINTRSAAAFSITRLRAIQSGKQKSLAQVFPGYLLVLNLTRRHGQGNEGSCRTRTEGDEGEGHEGQGEGHEGKEVKPRLSRVQSTCCVQRTPVVLARTGDASCVS